MNTTSTDNAAETTLGSEEAQTTSKRPKMIDYHREKAERLFGILSPIQISRKPRDLDEIYNCECPRVYWPVCSVDDITYVNACIANCLKIKIRRPGPCVLYRREA
ncbi:uncharacterized protein LOC121728312 [Aricia agestis]|uniref:uncharacterized protein LOC121728312 n=1 Tax=Aricia agestis TaxID=91739 RepID=UPI001C20293A|nr:uncharacterized protein LOC121728312 [Aricia agestis]